MRGGLQRGGGTAERRAQGTGGGLGKEKTGSSLRVAARGREWRERSRGGRGVEGEKGSALGREMGSGTGGAGGKEMGIESG